MFGFNWLYRFVRKRTKPIPEYTADIWKKRLSFGYAFLAWNAFGFVCYMIYIGKGDWGQHYSKERVLLTPAQQWSRTLGIKQATVYRISGMNVNKYDIHNDFESDASNETNIDFTETTKTEKTT